MSRVAVVILNYNGEKLLPKFLPSVVQNSGTAKVIIADNGSSDNSIAILEQNFPTVSIIRLPENYGFCGGYNHALRVVDADYYVLLNSDVEVTKDWLAPMQQLLDTDPDIAAVQPKILSFNHKNLFEYAGAGGGFIDSLGYPFCRGRIFNTVETDLGQYNDERQIFWASGACMMIRSNIYHHFNGLDEDFFAHMEEIDLCWKVQRTGKRIHYCGKSVVFHLGAGTLGYGSPRKTYLNFRNGLSMITKHLNTGELAWKLPLRIMLDWAAAMMFVWKGEFAHTKAVFNAHADYLKDLKKVLNKRRELRSRYPHYNSAGVYKGLVLVQFFVFRRTKLLP